MTQSNPTMQVVRYPEKPAWEALLKRPAADTRDMEDLVGSVFEEVRKKGDAALRAYTEQFDKVALKDLRVTSSEIESAARQVPDARRRQEGCGRVPASRRTDDALRATDAIDLSPRHWSGQA